jgi:hypothetical protein
MMIRIPILLSAMMVASHAFSTTTIAPPRPRIVVVVGDGPSSTTTTTVLRVVALPPSTTMEEEEEMSDEILNNPMFIPSPPTGGGGGGGGGASSDDGGEGPRRRRRRSPDELIYAAKRFLAGSNGLGGDPDLLSDDFRFEGPVVGPLSKGEFVGAIGRVDFRAAFPDWTPQFYGFHVDPVEPLANRVWYTARGRGVNAGPLPPFATEGSGVEVINPPQVCSITVDHDTGLISRYTIGYVVDRSVGNTGGLGGLYGILYAMGRPLPFPEARPWKKSWSYGFFQKIGSLLS